MYVDPLSNSRFKCQFLVFPMHCGSPASFMELLSWGFHRPRVCWQFYHMCRALHLESRRAFIGVRQFGGVREVTPVAPLPLLLGSLLLLLPPSFVRLLLPLSLPQEEDRSYEENPHYSSEHSPDYGAGGDATVVAAAAATRG